MNTSPCLLVFLLTLSSATIGKIAGESDPCEDIFCTLVVCNGGQRGIIDPGECCPRCPLGCDTKDGWKELGERWAPDPCTHCQCEDVGSGPEEMCAMLACMPPRCKDYFVAEGDCCPQCPPGCETEDGWKDFGDSWKPEPCTTCFCEADRNGEAHVQCLAMACAMPQCKDAFIAEGECCPQCPKCNPGDTIPSDDPCNEMCHCNTDGHVRCDQIAMDCVCGFLTQCECEGLYVPEGECCERCPEQDCSVIRCAAPRCLEEYWFTEPGACCPKCNGPEFECLPGEILTPEDPCSEQCHCDDNGQMVCFEMAVPCFCGLRTQCECKGLYVPEGECCAVCPEEDCTRVLCAIPQCPTEHQLTEPGTCCPRCDGPDYMCTPGEPVPSDDPCNKQCHCNDNGRIECYEIAFACVLIHCDNSFIAEGDCCPQCPPSCQTEDGAKQIGERWQPNPCTSCECYEDRDGQAQEMCAMAGCMAPLCKGAFTPEGECCPQCPTCTIGEPVPVDDPCSEECHCNANGRLECYEIAFACLLIHCDNSFIAEGDCCPQCPPSCEIGDHWEPDPCTFCDCVKDGNGQALELCAMMDCAMPDCKGAFTPKGECCPQCPPGCQTEDGVKQIGESWKPGPCTWCECAEDSKGQAQEMCAMAGCIAPQCQGAFTPEGECCPQCPTCTIGEPVPVDDPCHEECHCNDNGRIECYEIAVRCIALHCENSFMAEGDCCPQCPPSCKIGDHWEPDPCTMCDCVADKNGEAQELCAMMACAMQYCEGAFTPKGECCPQCPPGCTIGDHWEPDPCTFCDCVEDGNGQPQEMCAVMDCAMPDCEGAFTPEGECCPQCPTCKIGDHWEPDPCTMCDCVADKNGQAQELCAMMACAMMACEGAFTPEGECCPQCPTCKPGETWKPDPCTTCTCYDNGDFGCLGTPMSIPDCPQSVWVTDECGVPHCPECIPGTTWSPDACNTCNCVANDGGEPIAVCTKVYCPPDTCTPGDTWNDGPCTTCTCQDDFSVTCLGTPLSIPDCPKSMWVTDECGVPHCPDCSLVRCAMPDCPSENQVTPKGACCASCDGPQSGCVLGTRRKLEGDACTKCKCKAGPNGITQEVCKPRKCPVLDCEETYTKKGMCCPQCKPVCEGVRCAQLVCPKKFLKQKKNACCPRCTRCEGEICEPLDCPEDYQRTKRKECCPTCKSKWYRLQKLLARKAKKDIK